MVGWLFVIAGVVLGGLGALWSLQGFGYVGGSFMSGQPEWAVIGPIVVAVGIGLVVRGIGRLRAARLRQRSLNPTAEETTER